MSQYKNFINGTWREGASHLENINPSDTADHIGDYARGGATDLEEAVSAAESSLPIWSASTPQQRFDILDAVGSEILARKKELGTLLSREEGKTLGEGLGEVGRAGQIFKYFAGEALRLSGELLPSVRGGVQVEVRREPVGVIGLITPWNFPMAIPAWKVAPALAFGNTVILKPSEKTPACAWALAEIIARTALPPGAFNLLMGDGRTGNALVNQPRVAAVSFTGSVNTGRRVAAHCGARLAKVQLEMGGKNPLVILDDADLETAVKIAVDGAFFSTGQRCTASSRLIVTKGIHDRFVAALMDQLQHLKVDHALKDGTQIGPVVDAQQLEKNMDYLRIGREEGAHLACGGERLTRASEGFYQAPALFTQTHNYMRINREEIFGPIATCIAVADYEEALAVANDTPFGLSAGICTTSLKYANHFNRHAEAGMVMVNLPTAGVDYHVPFGGRKGSSYGSREQGSYAREFYTTVKTSYISA